MTLHSYVRTLTLFFHSTSFPASLSKSLLQTPPAKHNPYTSRKKKATKCFKVVESKRTEGERTQGNETPTTPSSTLTHSLTHTHTLSLSLSLPLFPSSLRYKGFSHSPSKCATPPSPSFSPPRPNPICWNQPCGPPLEAIPCDPAGEAISCGPLGEAIHASLPPRPCGPPRGAMYPRFPPSRSPSSRQPSPPRPNPICRRSPCGPPLGAIPQRPCGPRAAGPLFYRSTDAQTAGVSPSAPARQQGKPTARAALRSPGCWARRKWTVRPRGC